ncbi:AraC family transcriptional regulator [Actinoplanes lobatus]|uniref:AraC family transcriptional regulator n=1 Tax=Actinoplanes lobatus TaxID=113568 RepID=A0A7W7HM39_9ACTN|nr:AraC family transcriptional regulator [Actinoplanes lobatus]MBB4752996.1 AraC-like DNA-binding protein [Actinoplanes lobatus]GGN87519.1 AraC family transcriptional regulator [Actinoplanes lobatus]GIE39603.1 AraC family transcriptional regulator [Actinoplanes lobatus]
MAAFDWADVNVTVPRTPHRLPGVRMAGFSHHASGPVDIAMIAHPAVTLLFNLGPGEFTVHLAPDGPGRIAGSTVIGLLPGAVRTAGTNGDLLQVRLEPTVATVVLGSCTELTGTVTALHDVWGHDAEARLRAATSWEDRFATAAEVLRRRLDGGRTVDREVAHAWRRIRTSHGRIRVDDLAGEVGWSRQRLWSRFRSQLGIVPKRAARLARFDQAAHLLAAGRPIADVAARAGYTDQSHLHRDAGEFTGLTPAAVAAAPWLAIDDVTWPGPG